MPPYSFFDLAFDVLKNSSTPLTYQEIWQNAVACGYADKINSAGKTPWQTLGSRLYVDVRDNKNSRFEKVGSRPARFFLKARRSELASDSLAATQSDESRNYHSTATFHEQDLHPLLTYFAYANPVFGRGRSIFTKTIPHEKSLRTGYSKWVYPDMVGVYLPIDDWCADVFALNRLSDNNALHLYSFELKKSLNRSNYRAAYFQAVSNSSWAHEGYLVTAEVIQDDEFLAELSRLVTAFGIGIIVLDLQDIDSSSILYPARHKRELDWETINKLSEQNRDFSKFLQDVKIAFESKRIHRSEFDKVIIDIQQFIKDKFNIVESL